MKELEAKKTEKNLQHSQLQATKSKLEAVKRESDRIKATLRDHEVERGGNLRELETQMSG